MAKEFAKPFYNSKEWQKVRAYCLLRDRYKCQKCGKPAEEVHHIIHIDPQNIYDIRITLNPDNLVSLCKDCHFNEHSRKIDVTGDEYTFDENGMLIEATPPVGN